MKPETSKLYLPKLLKNILTLHSEGLIISFLTFLAGLSQVFRLQTILLLIFIIGFVLMVFRLVMLCVTSLLAGTSDAPCGTELEHQSPSTSELSMTCFSWAVTVQVSSLLRACSTTWDIGLEKTPLPLSFSVFFKMVGDLAVRS